MFDLLDRWKHPINLFHHFQDFRNLIFKFALLTVPLWVLLGFDSGVDILVKLLENILPFLQGSISFQELTVLSYEGYGQSFHFSSYLIYGWLFYAISKHLESLDIKYSRNLLFSGCLMMLNVAIFEWFYMGLFAVFQTQRYLIEWFVSDFWFLHQYLWLLILGLMGGFAVYVESFNDNGRTFTFKTKWKFYASLIVTFLTWLLWIYYPFPIQTFNVGNWTSKILFPQTNYAYFGYVYIPNNLLHGVNVLAKGLTAVTQVQFFRGFKKC